MRVSLSELSEREEARQASQLPRLCCWLALVWLSLQLSSSGLWRGEPLSCLLAGFLLLGMLPSASQQARRTEAAEQPSSKARPRPHTSL
jgi:hypothetical protein